MDLVRMMMTTMMDKAGTTAVEAGTEVGLAGTEAVEAAEVDWLLHQEIKATDRRGITTEEGVKEDLEDLAHLHLDDHHLAMILKTTMMRITMLELDQPVVAKK